MQREKSEVNQTRRDATRQEAVRIVTIRPGSQRPVSRLLGSSFLVSQPHHIIPSVVNRLPGSLCSSVSDDEPITVLSHRSTSAPPFLSRFFRLGSVPLHSRLITGGTK